MLEPGEKILSTDKEGPRKVEYGNNSVPVSLFCGKMSEEYLKQLHKLEMFCCPEKELEKMGFQRCVDYPRLPQHVYYEGYFHSCRTSEAVTSVNPRDSSIIDKPAAPPLLRAMYIAFREKNSEWMHKIWEEIKKVEMEGEEGEQARKVFENAFNPNNNTQLLGDLAVQVHYGHAIDGHNVGYHTDALNSVFHYAFSVHGNRILHSFRASDHDRAQNADFDHYQDPQEVRDVYISLPAFFYHGVEYPECKWENRIIAIQARFLFNEEEWNKTNRLRGEGKEGEGKKIIAQAISNALISGPVLPSLKEILEVCATLD
eukprot:CAMPEP_0201515362 /NCGR_PEP_ID=MMETSP0161_2-20130828/6951_1 /ASSEMBLY_ACC=CAM_ASM_000251 /TAXON_ID=180227 /ORGANISM="Neoparamoeba aestuarina, Strain SoJaBio B1-5/56/2" /LENGTH=314 /DNA_ID=CAMNT_0047912163 /DNA_START=176 /DNA_END=1120 /DNA_ORIENTATION=+